MLFSICLCSRCCKGNNCFIPVSCPCLSIFVLVFYVVLVSSYRRCCLPFPSCSVFLDGWLMFVVFMDGCVCACVSLLVFFCASFRSVVCCLCSLHSCLCVVSHSFRNSLSFACCPWLCLWLLLWSLLFVSFLRCCSWLPLSVGFRRFCVCAMEFFNGWQILI